MSKKDPKTESAKVVPFPPSASAPPPPVAKSAREAKLRSEKKWGVEVMSVGFCILPSLLFRAQHRLGLKSTHLAVILQLAEFWWHDDKLPFPKKQTIAERMGLKEKQVQRLIAELQQRGYVERKVRKTPHGQTSNEYDLSGLVKKLQELAPEFIEAAAAKRKAERRGGLRIKTA
jgi:predicted transcriptional regulator